MIGFWRWLLWGVSGGESGIKRAFMNRRVFLIHLPVGVFLAWFTINREDPSKISDIAGALILPLAGVLIGLCFAWGGHATALMQTREIESVIDKRGKGVEDYVFGYQFAILAMLVVIIAWGLGSMGMFDMLKGCGDYVIRSVLFFLASFSVNQCWSAALFASGMLQVMLQDRYDRRKRAIAKKQDKDKSENPSREVSSPEVNTT